MENSSNIEKFRTYEEYLEDLMTEQDVYYLEDLKICRQIAELGMRSENGMETLSREEFYKKKEELKKLDNPSITSDVMFYADAVIEDPFLKALAKREQANRVGELSSIIFVVTVDGKGTEISGYIDFADSLQKARKKEYKAVDWRNVYKAKTLLIPKPSDLGYHNWSTNKSSSNDSENFQSILDPKEGLLFIHTNDRMLIRPDPFADSFGTNSHRSVFQTNLYQHAVIYDHIVRK